MSILSAIWNIIKRMLSRIFKAIMALVKKLLPLILIVVGLYFAGPLIGTWLASVGAPTWLAGTFSAIPGWINLIGSWAWGALGTLGSQFAAAEFTTQMQIVGAAATLLAPEETAELLEEVAVLAGDVLSSVVEGVTGLSFSGIAMLCIGGYLAYKLLTRERQPQLLGVSNDPSPSST